MRYYLFFLIGISTLSLAAASAAAQPAVWTVDSRPETVKGNARNVTLSDDGSISLAPAFKEIYKTGQSFIWSSAVDQAGNIYLGTGGEGKIFRIDPQGKGSELADLAEANVTAIAIGNGGQVFAATSPDGKVYRIDAAGKAEVYFAPGEKYIWSLAMMNDGSLAIGTGDTGKIYRVRSANAEPKSSLFFDTSETHIICLTVDKNGDLYAGTDSSGLVLRFGADGKPFGILDSPLREIHELAIGSDGSVYALAIGESVSAKPAEAATVSTDPAVVTVEKPTAAATETAARSRYDMKDVKSAVYRVSKDGIQDVLWSSTAVTGFSLAARDGGVLLGTSDKGRIYSIGNNSDVSITAQSDAGQISTLVPTVKGVIATSSNQGSAFRLGPEPFSEGSYESPVLDAKQSATWGRIWWRSSGSVSLQTRSGNTESPNESWTPWSSAISDPKGGQIVSPSARFLQWRAVLKPASATLYEASISFAARNVEPEVTGITILPKTVGLAPTPATPIDPNIELSGLDPAIFGVVSGAAAPRKLYQRNAVSIQWTADDRNGDKLRYDIFYREIGESSFHKLRGDLDDTFMTIDGQTLADGKYIFKVVASDSPSNPLNTALEGERLTDPVLIDNTQPIVTAVGSGQIVNGRLRISFDASDADRITNAFYSLNSSQWLEIYPEDGISDGSHERFTIDIPVTPANEYSISLKIYDASGNTGNARVVVKR